MKWLDRVIAARFPKMHAPDRERVCEQVIEAIPLETVEAAIKVACSEVLIVRNVRDGAGDLSAVIAARAAAYVVHLLGAGA